MSWLWIVSNVSKLIISIGLLCDLCGAILLALNLLSMTEDDAINEVGTKLMSDNKEENLTDPDVQRKLQFKNKAILGACILGFGFLLQLLGIWVK